MSGLGPDTFFECLFLLIKTGLPHPLYHSSYFPFVYTASHHHHRLPRVASRLMANQFRYTGLRPSWQIFVCVGVL